MIFVIGMGKKKKQTESKKIVGTLMKEMLTPMTTEKRAKKVAEIVTRIEAGTEEKEVEAKAGVAAETMEVMAQHHFLSVIYRTISGSFTVFVAKYCCTMLPYDASL